MARIGPNDYKFPYILYVPQQAVGANLVFFSVWNGSSVALLLSELFARADKSVAVAGLVAVKLFATRTTAIGTGGTAATAESAVLTEMSFSKALPSLTLISGLSGRLTPTGGATAGAVLGEAQLLPEEVTAGESEKLLVRAPVVIPAGTGFRVVQGAVASVGLVGFSAVLQLYKA